MSQAGLRQRKKAAAMNRIQKTALELFSERGFAAVRIEEIASAAEVSPSTVYRYFGTKEGLVLRDEFDERIEAVVIRELANREQTIIEVARKMVDAVAEEHFVVERAMTLERLRLCFDDEELKAAGALSVARACLHFAERIHDLRGVPLAEARVLSSTVIGAMMSAMVSWYSDGGTRHWSVYCHEAFDLIDGRLPEGR